MSEDGYAPLEMWFLAAIKTKLVKIVFPKVINKYLLIKMITGHTVPLWCSPVYTKHYVEVAYQSAGKPQVYSTESFRRYST